MQFVSDTIVRKGKSLHEAIGEATSLLRDDFGDMEAAQLRSVFQLKRGFQKTKAHVWGHSPNNFADLNNIPNDLVFTKRGDRFLLEFTSYYDEKNRYVGPIIIYATKANLLNLVV